MNPFFSTDLSPIRNSPQNNLFANSHGEIFNILTRKFVALITSGVTFILCAVPDLTLPAMHKQFIRQAASALNIFYGKVLTAGESPFSGNFPLVQAHKPFLEFAVIITVCDINGTDSAIKTTRRNKIRIYLHIITYSSDSGLAGGADISASVRT
ncbi:hypothetical protein SBDP1_390001 [Syntrophobacter sp. SbD1]|nr:hypothetical protein SBDP1_390001 [Syntrophobacter sp. SbD1]